VVRERSAKPLCSSTILLGTFCEKLRLLLLLTLRRSLFHDWEHGHAARENDTMPLHLAEKLANSIRDHGAADYPQECCGFLIGTAHPMSPDIGAGGGITSGPEQWDGGDETVIVARVVPADNTRLDSPRNRFEIAPGELVKVDRAARADGLSVVGFYHSHPDAPARPSEYDREHAWPGYCYVIVSVENSQPKDVKNWRLRDDRSRFEEDPIL
jgi:proteasome lid subunit RPN8/RPN11